MSTEKLTAEDKVRAIEVSRGMPFTTETKRRLITAMEEYATQEAEYKTKQLKNEMDMAIELLKEVQLFHGSDPDISIDLEIENFIEQSNRKHDH